jgi:hypothetical protein
LNRSLSGFDGAGNWTRDLGTASAPNPTSRPRSGPLAATPPATHQQGADMAIAVNRSFNQDIDGILWGYRWDDNNFTYSFPTGISGYTGYTQINGFEAFNAAQQTAVNRALANIASFANVTFTQVSASTPAELRFAEATSYNSNDGRGLHAPGNSGRHYGKDTCHINRSHFRMIAGG